MRFDRKFTPEEAAPILERFISLYVDRRKVPKFRLLWNSLQDSVRRRCLSFPQAAALKFFEDKGETPLLLYDERERTLCQVKWAELVRCINGLEPWEESIDLLIFDESLRWFLAVTHEDLLTICAGEALPD